MDPAAQELPYSVTKSNWSGRSNRKVDPWPGLDSTLSLASMVSASRFASTSPKPTPPYCRLIDSQ